MYFVASLFAAFAITIFLVSKIAKMLHANRPEIGWILLASIVGSALAGVGLVSLGLFVQGLDPTVMLIVSIAVVLIVSSAAFKYINKMSWSGAITTNIASVVISLMTLVAAVVLNGESLEKTFNTINLAAKQNAAIVGGVAADSFAIENDLNNNLVEVDDATTDEEISSEELEPMITELDLLPAGAAKEAEKKAKVTSRPKYRVVNIGSINTAVGRRIKILSKSGKNITGLLKQIRGNDAVILKRVSNGESMIPISISSIQKLQVYR